MYLRHGLKYIYGCRLARGEWPILLKIGITSRCNMRCYMCKTHFNDTPESTARYQDMSEELFLKIEPLIRKAYYITFSGIGEPTIASHFLKRVRIIRQLNPQAYLKIDTNGALLSSPGFAEEMVPLFDYIHLSLNGVKSYTEMSGGHSFENIRRSLQNIRLIRKRLKKPCKFTIGFILMKKNIRDIVEAAVLSKEMEADKIYYSDLRIHSDTLKTESARHDPELASLMLEEIKKAVQVGIPVRCRLQQLSPKGDTKSFSLKSKSAPWNLDKMENRALIDRLRISRRKLEINFKNFSLPCYEPWESVHVYQNGKVRLCCNGLNPIGDLTEKSFEEIWSGNEANHHRKGIITGHYYKNCARCRLIFKDKPKSYENYPKETTGDCHGRP